MEDNINAVNLLPGTNPHNLGLPYGAMYIVLPSVPED